MKEDWHNIDDLFKKGIKDYTGVPNPDSFAAIQQKMAEQYAAKRKRRRYIYYAVSLLCLLSVSGYYGLQQLSFNDKTSPPIVSAENSGRTAISSPDSKNYLSGSYNGPYHLIPDITGSTGSFSTPADKQHKKINSNNKPELKVLSPGDEKPDRKKETIGNTSRSDNYFRHAQAPKAQAPKVQAPKAQAGSAPFEKPFKKAFNNNQLARSFTEWDNSASKGMPDKLPVLPLDEQIIKPDDSASGKLTDITPSKEEPYFRMTAIFAPEVSYRSISSWNSEGEKVKEERASDSYKTNSYSASIIAETPIAGCIFGGMGVSWTNTGERYYKKEYSLARIAPVSFYYNKSNIGAPMQKSRDFSPQDSVLLTNTYQYLGVPLIAGVQKRWGRFLVKAFTGVTGQVLVNEQEQELYTAMYTKDRSVKVETQTTEMRRFNLSSWTSVEASLNITENIAVGFGPDFRYFISSTVPVNSGIEHHPYSVGLHASLSCSFR